MSEPRIGIRKGKRIMKHKILVSISLAFALFCSNLKFNRRAVLVACWKSIQPHKLAGMSRGFGKIPDKKCINIQKTKEKFEVKEKRGLLETKYF